MDKKATQESEDTGTKWACYTFHEAFVLVMVEQAVGCENSPGESFSQRVFSCQNDDAGQSFQILVCVRDPVFILTASPRLQHSHNDIKFNLMS